MYNGRVQLYRRHIEDCPHASKGAAWTRCNCPIYADGLIDGKRFRRSMRTRSWSQAEAKLAAVQRSSPEDQAALVSPRLSQAVAAYIEDLKFRRKSENTVIGYRCQLQKFVGAMGVTPLRDIDSDAIQGFLASKKGKRSDGMVASTLRKEVAVLRAFYAFCQRKGWVTENPAKDVSKPKIPKLVTQPLDRRDLDRMFAFARSMRGRRGLEARALLYTLTYTGFRISDVSNLRRGDYNRKTGYLTLPWMEKTGKPVRLKLHPDAVGALDALGGDGERWFYLWGAQTQGARIKKLRGRLTYIGDKLGIRANPHRFRDTFAVELLTNGADLRTVQHLLGHESIETTEKHYAHFVAEHQSILDRATSTLKFGDNAPRPFVVNAHND